MVLTPLKLQYQYLYSLVGVIILGLLGANGWWFVFTRPAFFPRNNEEVPEQTLTTKEVIVVVTCFVAILHEFLSIILLCSTCWSSIICCLIYVYGTLFLIPVQIIITILLDVYYGPMLSKKLCYMITIGGILLAFFSVLAALAFASSLEQSKKN